MCYIILSLLFKIGNCEKTSLISISYDPPLLPSKDLIFFVCVASASVKQIDPAIT